MTRVLLIDDDPLVRQTLNAMLTGSGYEVAEAENGEEGLAVFADSAFEAAVVDILMPEKEGLETVQELRRLQPDLAILTISGGPSIRFAEAAGDLDFLRMARTLGADEALRKPFTRSALLGALESALQRRRPLTAG